MKGAIESANWVSTVSPTYAKEILDPWFAHKLDPILRERAWKLSGILNGIDVVGYDPATDKNLYETYDAKHLEGKAVNKAKLQERLGLAVDPDVPLIGMVTRLVSHKGLDLVKGGVDNIMTYSNAQFVVLGSGDWEYEQFFKEMQAKYPGRFAVPGLCTGACAQDLRRLRYFPDAEQERAVRSFTDGGAALRFHSGRTRNGRPEGLHYGQRRRQGQRLHVPDV